MKKTLIAVAVLGLMAGTVQAQEVVVKIGHVGPLTGNIAHLGKDNENGARLAVEEYNAKGVSIGGKKVKFELIGEDDAADPKTGNIVAQRIVDAGVKGVVGHLNSGTTIPASRIYNSAGIPMISPSSTNVTLTQQGFPYIFRTMANDAQQGSVIGKYAATKLGKKVAIIDDRTAYGQGLADEVEKGVKANGGTVSSREFTNNQATDFSAILTKIKAQNPDVIVYTGMDAQGGPMLKQIKQLGIKTRFVTGDGGCTPEFIKLAGDSISDAAYCTQAGLPLDQIADKGFKDRFKKRFGADVQIYAPYAYDAAAALIEGMKAANSSDPAKYLPALKKVQFKGVTGEVAFDDKGDTKFGAITMYQFKAGNWVALK
ncbi:branched-chain amino acid ABC transporter substrate-binding protein [Uliginosibacterium sp. 31-16]|uniref:branched-chain amino acid ABC transporter substrate-binding protein n=1 Tax=Uliginosibacterium sp. 31-16 TaxID=3068315 RepID=UPI00273F2B95|nr:branched-chain amino acid ABC transporter substrate-binding protein [Uliginosibacterium sp. 31-16]MDP5238415.1 branched-chain amino acid ABC transporter substrate-binding protein [Uliginosibacterium sp. 31-16]